jgi:outer membrane protein assembly factor BamB
VQRGAHERRRDVLALAPALLALDRMHNSSVVTLGLTLVISSAVSAAPHSGRVFPATLRAMPPPPLAYTERIAALFNRERREPAVEIAARWTAEAPVAEAAVVGDRAIYVDNNTFRAMSLRDGTQLAKADISGCTTAFSRDGETLYAGCYNGVAQVDPVTLAVRWEQQWPPEQHVAQLADADGALVVSLAGRDATELVALERDGTTRWHTQLPSRWIELRSDGHALFAFETDPTVWRLDPRSGHVLWSRASAQPIDDVVAMPGGVTAIVRAKDLSLVDRAGRDLLTGARNPHLVAFAAHGAQLFACDDDGVVHATDVRSGRELWWARVSTAGEPCALLGATNERVLLAGAERVIALDTTHAAPPPPAVTIRGRFRDTYNEKPQLRGVLVHVGQARVRTDRRGRFVATVRAHGPIDVRLDGHEGSESRAVVWPDGHARRHVELSNFVDDSCH